MCDDVIIHGCAFVCVAGEEEELKPVDLSSGSILPTLDMKKFSRYADMEIRECVDL